MKAWENVPEVVLFGGDRVAVDVMPGVFVLFPAEPDAEVRVEDEFVPFDLAAEQELDAIDVFIGAVHVDGIFEGNVFVRVKHSFIEQNRLEVSALCVEGGLPADEVPFEAGPEPEAAAFHELFGADAWFALANVYPFKKNVVGVIGIDPADAQFEAEFFGEVLFEVNIQFINNGGRIYLEVGPFSEGIVVILGGGRQAGDN